MRGESEEVDWPLSKFLDLPNAWNLVITHKSQNRSYSSVHYVVSPSDHIIILSTLAPPSRPIAPPPQTVILSMFQINQLF